MLAGAAAFALTGVAAAETPPGFYLDAAIGGNWVQDLNNNFGTVAVPRYAEFESGFFGAGSAGFKWDNGIRVEGEVGYRTNDFNIGNTGITNGDSNTFSLMLNALYDIDVAPGWVISLGGGVGTARIGADFPGPAGSGTILDDRDWSFAYQGIAEVEMMATENLGVFVGYNYFGVEDFGLYNVANNLIVDDYIAHSGYIGLRWHFYEPEAPPPPPPPPPTPAKTFIVFFGFDRYDLTPEANAVIGEAAAAFKSTGAVTVAVVGHTDTVGSAAYNQALSERRAGTVKSGLVSNGVPEGAISTSGRGFSEPLVATGPGVKEPQNRRATIDLSGSAT